MCCIISEKGLMGMICRGDQKRGNYGQKSASLSESSLHSCEIIEMCHQWSPRPDRQSHQKRSLFSGDVCFVLRYFENIDILDVRTETSAKILITTGLNYGSAEKIKNIWPSCMNHSYFIVKRAQNYLNTLMNE